MSRYKRGDKHPTKNLIFYQYHPEIKGGERWLTPEEFQKQKRLHADSTTRKRRKSPFEALVATTGYRHRNKYGEPVNLITAKWVEEQWEQQKGICYWFNVPMTLEYTNTVLNKRFPLKVSIDRLDCTKGYTQDNCVLCCYAANCGRGNATVEEWIESLKIIKDGLQQFDESRYK